MNKLIISIVFLFLVPESLFGLDIPEECKVKNPDPGYCAFVSLEILGRTHKLHPMFGMVKRRQLGYDVLKNNIVYPKNLGYNWAIRDELDSLGVNYLMQDSGFYEKDLLRYSKEFGCVIAVDKGALEKQTECHAIILTDYNKEGLEFFDCNKPDKLWKATHQWLDVYWTGLSIVVKK